MVHMVRAVLTGWSTGSGFDLAWFSSVFRAPLCLQSSWCYMCYNLKKNSLLYFLVCWAWWDWLFIGLTNCCSLELWHCWFGHVTCTISNWATSNCNTDVQVATRLRTVVSLRCMQVSTWLHSPSPLVWRHHMHHTVVQNLSGRQFVWCRWTAALEQAACFTVVLWQSLPIQKSWIRFCLSRTRLQHLVTLAFRRPI